MNNKFLYPKGSEWRKWDLHVHTPSSALNNHFEGRGEDEKWENYFKKLSSLTDIAVLGFTDYFSIEGYKKVKYYKDAGNLDNIEMLLPNVELRILPVTSEDIPINLHIIFSPEVVGGLDSKFFSSLEFTYQGEIFKCIKTDIIKLGRKYRNDDSLSENAAYKCGVEQFKVSFGKIKEIIQKDTLLQDNSFIVISNRSEDGVSGIQHSSLAATREEIYRFAHAIFSSNPADREYFLGRGTDNEEKIMRKYGALKPCIHGSDAHWLEKICKPDLNRYTWIKSDPTFEGLKQIIYEPEERVFIDEKEPEILRRVAENKTKFINLLKISQVDKYNENKGKWFKDIEFPLNFGLVAIIGNKGNGKSAITDILGLCGNSHLYKDFSFLREDKFLKDDLAKNFVAQIQWESGESINKNLGDSTDTKTPERVRYIPQNFFERLTNDLESYEFEKTLEDVVFSYLPDEQKLNKNSFEELFRYKKQIKDKEIEEIPKEIKVLNQQIIELEKKIYPAYEVSIRKKLEIGKKELEEHEKNKPKKIPDPHKDKTLDKKRKELLEKMNSLNEDFEKNRQEIKTTKENLKKISIEIQDLEIIRADLQRYEIDIKNYIKQNKKKFSKYGLNISEMVVVKINIEKITDKINEKKRGQKEIKKLLITEDDLKDMGDEKERELIRKNCLIIKEKKIENQIDTIKKQLSEPEKKYQEYLENLKKWEDRKRQIEGDENKKDTIKWLEKELKYIREQAQKDLDKLRDDRLNLVGKIHEKKIELVIGFSTLLMLACLVLSNDSSVGSGISFRTLF